MKDECKVILKVLSSKNVQKTDTYSCAVVRRKSKI